MRGEDLTGHGLEAGFHTDLPLRLLEWEPAYPLAEYTADEVTSPAPDAPTPRRLGDPTRAKTTAVEIVDEPDAVAALRGIVAHWVERSNGRSEALAVAGDHRQALRALGVPRPRLVEVPGPVALALVAWAAGSAAPTDAGEAWPRHASRSGGSSPPLPGSSTTGPSTPTSSARWSTSSGGSCGTPPSPRRAGPAAVCRGPGRRSGLDPVGPRRLRSLPLSRRTSPRRRCRCAVRRARPARRRVMRS